MKVLLKKYKKDKKNLIISSIILFIFEISLILVSRSYYITPYEELSHISIYAYECTIVILFVLIIFTSEIFFKMIKHFFISRNACMDANLLENKKIKLMQDTFLDATMKSIKRARKKK